jgi:RNA polymerase sigma factor (sigma-70 family)
MRDSEVVASIKARDPGGLAEAYDKYAARIFSFCRSLLGEPAAAAYAVQETFVIAASAVSELHDPNRLRPWLYAVARSQCHRRLRAGDLPAAHDETAGHGGAGDDDEHLQLLDLVRTAMLGLEPGDREIIELSLRHRLHGLDLADTLGVPRHHVHALVSRARGRLEETLGALLVARAGWGSCLVLDELLGDEDGTTAPAHDRVSRHLEVCPVCAERQRQLLGPVMRLGFASGVPIPRGLRNRVLRLAADPLPAAVAERTAIEQQAGAFAAYGFPEAPPAEPAAGRRWRLAPMPLGTLAGAAACAVVAAVTALVVLVLPQASHGGGPAGPAHLSEPVSPAAHGAAAPTGTAGNTGTFRTPASGTREPASEARVQGGTGQAGGTTGALAVQGGRLYALSGTESAGSGSTGTVRASTSPAKHTSSPANGTESNPTTSGSPTTSSTPSTNPAPSTSPSPTASPTPSTSPAPSDTPTSADPGTPTTGATISVSVGGLLSVRVDIGN